MSQVRIHVVPVGTLLALLREHDPSIPEDATAIGGAVVKGGSIRLLLESRHFPHVEAGKPYPVSVAVRPTDRVG